MSDKKFDYEEVDRLIAEGSGMNDVVERAKDDLHMIGAQSVASFGGSAPHIGQWGASPAKKKAVEAGLKGVEEHKDGEFRTGELLREEIGAAIAKDREEGGFKNASASLEAVGRSRIAGYVKPQGKFTDSEIAKKLEDALSPDDGRGLSR